MASAEKGQEQVIMGRPPIFEKAKSKPISASEGFWKDMQTLADKLQNAGTPGGGNVSRMIRDIFNPMIADSDESCQSFQRKVATRSKARLPVIGAQRRWSFCLTPSL